MRWVMLDERVSKHGMKCPAFKSFQAIHSRAQLAGKGGGV